MLFVPPLPVHSEIWFEATLEFVDDDLTFTIQFAELDPGEAPEFEPSWCFERETYKLVEYAENSSTSYVWFTNRPDWATPTGNPLSHAVPVEIWDQALQEFAHKVKINFERAAAQLETLKPWLNKP